MNDWLLIVEPWTFFVLAVLLFGLLGILAYQKKAASAFVVLVGAVFSSSFVYLDHISEIAATATSLTIKVREASDALVELRKVAALTGEALITLDAQSGMIGGNSASHRDQLKKQVLEVLRSINLDEKTMKRVEDADRDRSLSDYAWAILNHGFHCVLTEARGSGWNDDFMKLQLNAGSWPPAPEVIQKLLVKYDVHDDFTEKAYNEYLYFFKTGQHQDSLFWLDRDSWPTEPQSAPGNGGKCAH